MKIEIAEIEHLKKDIKELELTWMDFVLPVLFVAVFFIGTYIFRYYSMIGGTAIWAGGFTILGYMFDKLEKSKSYYFEDDEDDEDYYNYEDDDYYDEDYDDEDDEYYDEEEDDDDEYYDDEEYDD